MLPEMGKVSARRVELGLVSSRRVLHPGVGGSQQPALSWCTMVQHVKQFQTAEAVLTKQLYPERDFCLF
jgi:hypothetical protein